MASSNWVFNNGNGKKVTLTNPDTNNSDVVVDISKIVEGGATGGSTSAGAGKQYVVMTVNGVNYKILHDGVL